MITYVDAFAKLLHYMVDYIMECNLQLVYIYFGEISSNEFPPPFAIDDILITFWQEVRLYLTYLRLPNTYWLILE